MIEVSCPSSRMNNHQYLYSRWNKMELIKLSIKEDSMNYEKELTVAEAEQLAKDLMEWVKEIKGDQEEESDWTDQQLANHFKGWSDDALQERRMDIIRFDLTNTEFKMVEREIERRKEAEEVA